MAVGTDLHQCHMSEAGVQEPAYRFDVPLYVRPARDRLCDLLLGDRGTATWPYRGLPAPPAASNRSTSSRFGSVAMSTSAYRPASWHDRGPDTATPTGTPSSGRSHSRASGTSK